MSDAKDLDPPLHIFGDAVVGELSQRWGQPMGVVLFAIEQDGTVHSTTNVPVEEYRSFIAYVANATRTGEYTFEEPPKETEH